MASSAEHFDSGELRDGVRDALAMADAEEAAGNAKAAADYREVARTLEQQADEIEAQVNPA